MLIFYRFPVDDNATMKSVVEYFQEMYGFTIQHTHLPCLQVGNQRKANYLPMEVRMVIWILPRSKGAQKKTKETDKQTNQAEPDQTGRFFKVHILVAKYEKPRGLVWFSVLRC